MTIGEQIKKHRKEACISQAELGKHLGISQQQIAQYENGKRIPKLETIERIAEALNISVINLIKPYSFEKYQNTKEYKREMMAVDAYLGVIAILKEIYGDVVEKAVEEEWGDSYYYVVGKGENKFILYEGDIDMLLDYAKSSFPFVVDGIKNTKSEQEVINEIRTDLKSPKYIEKIKKYIQDNP